MKTPRWIAVSTLSLLLLLAGCSSKGEELRPFAQCLTDQEFVMYGAYWCPHCQDQKELFGKSIDAVTYVECDAQGKDAQPALCLEKGIKVYPTWIRSDGTVYESVQTLQKLAKNSGCELPAGVEADEEPEVKPEVEPEA